MKNKTIVFVGGSAYSGSTILDMMIASGEKGISIGEAHALFYPFRKKHLTPVCGCGSDECNIWYEIKKKKPSQLYTELFKRFPAVAKTLRPCLEPKATISGRTQRPSGNKLMD